jgi:HrpA-like RNA helicase
MLEIQARNELKGWPFPTLMCTATMSDRLADAVDQMHPTRIECPKRLFLSERYQVEMESLTALYDAMATCAAELLFSHKTVLVFLPGQAEISSLQDHLASEGAGSKIGVWGVSNREIDFGFGCGALSACVRACEAVCGL